MIYRALFTRPVLRRPVRFCATVLGVAAGVAAVVATLSANRAALASLREGVSELAGAVTIEISRAGGVDEIELARLAPLAEDALILPVVDRVALFAHTGAGPGDTVRLLGLDLISDPRFRPATANAGSGVAEESLDGEFDDRALVAESFAREFALSPGDRLSLVVAAQPVELRLADTFPDAGAAVLGRVVIVDVATALRLASGPGTLDRIELIPRRGVRQESLAEHARSLVSSNVTVGSPQDRAAATSTLVRSLEFNLTIMSAISLLVAGVLVATTLATSVVQRRRTIALLYALGAARGQVVRAILAEAFVIGLAGGAVGILLGWAGAHLLVSGVRATLSTVVATTAPNSIPLHGSHAWIGLGAGVVVALAAGLLPVLEGSRTPPIQALRGEAPTFLSRRSLHIAVGLAVMFLIVAAELIQLPAWHGLPVAAIAGALALLAAMFATFGPLVDALGRVAGARVPLPVTVRLAGAVLSSGRRRAAWAAGAIGMAVALSIAIATLVTSFRSTVVDWVEVSVHADFTIRPVRSSMGVPVGGLSRELVALAKTVPGTSAVYPYYVSSATYQGERIGLGAVSFRAASERGWSQMQDGTDSALAIRRAARESLVLVTEAGAHRFGWRAGDLLRIDVRGHALERRIAGVYIDHSESQGFVLIDESDYLAWLPHDNPVFIDVNCSRPEDVEAVRAALLAATAGRFEVEINDRETMRRTILSVFDRTFAITGALQSVSALVAILAVLSVLFAILFERRADLALLSAIGADTKQVYTLVAAQGGLLGLVGALPGALTGLVIGFVLVTVVNVQSFGWTLKFVRPWSTLFYLSAFVILACIVAAAIPARTATGAGLREALREE